MLVLIALLGQVTAMGTIKHSVIAIGDQVINFVSDLPQAGLWFSAGTPVSSTNKTDIHDITEILLKVALNTINLNQTIGDDKNVKIKHWDISRQLYKSFHIRFFFHDKYCKSMY